MKMFKWLASILSCITMSIAPLAQGVEAERHNMQITQEVLQELGFTGPHQVKTIGEMWDKVKKDVPQPMRDQLQLWVNFYRKEKLPQVSLQAAEGNKSSDIVKMVMTRGSETMTFEVIGEKEKFMKVNGIVLTSKDATDVASTNQKLNKIPNIGLETKRKYEELVHKSIIPTWSQFQAMNKADRLYFYVHLRLLMDATVKVQNAFGMQTASIQEFNKYIVMLKALVGDDAGAVEPKTATKNASIIPKNQPKQAGPPAKGKVAPAWQGNCVVAGFIAEYETVKGNYCDQQKIKFRDEEQKQQFLKDTEICKSNNVNSLPCNGEIFGYDTTPSTNPYCVPIDTSRGSDFQTATNFCDQQHKITDDNGNYLPDEGAKLIKSIIVKKGVDAGLTDKGKAKSQKDYDKIMEKILKPMKEAIENGITACSRPINEPNQNKSEKSACATLKKRQANLQLLMRDLCEGDFDDAATPAATCKPKVADKDPDVKCEIVIKDSNPVQSCNPTLDPKKAEDTKTDGKKDEGGRESGTDLNKKDPAQKDDAGETPWYKKPSTWGIVAGLVALFWWLRKRGSGSAKAGYNPAPSPCAPGNTVCNPTPGTTTTPGPITPEGGSGTNTNIDTGGTLPTTPAPSGTAR